FCLGLYPRNRPATTPSETAPGQERLEPYLNASSRQRTLSTFTATNPKCGEESRLNAECVRSMIRPSRTRSMDGPRSVIRTMTSLGWLRESCKVTRTLDPRG